MVKSRKRSKRRALSEIKKYQSGKYAVSTLIPKSCFDRVVRHMGNNYKFGVRFRDDAMEGLQHATESYIVQLLAKANRICVAGKRETLSANDIRLALSIAEDKEYEDNGAVSQELEQTEENLEDPEEDTAEEDPEDTAEEDPEEDPEEDTAEDPAEDTADH